MRASRLNSPRAGTLWNRRFEILFAVAAMVAVALLLYLGRWLTFYHDEWTFIDQRGEWTFDALMRPHNEHWPLGMALAYKTLLSAVGLRSYLPYLLVLLLLHVATAAGLYRVLKHLSGPAFALAGSTLLLFIGSAYENLYWGFQIGWVGSTAAGTWAVALLLLPKTRRRLILAAILLVVSVASQGTGLFFFAGATVILLADPERRSDVWVVAPAAILGTAWFVFLGRSSISSNRDPFTLESLSHLPEYVSTGVVNAIGVLTGLGQPVGLVIFGLLAVATVWHLVGKAPMRAAAVAGFVGLIAQFSLTGLVRVGQATSSRYVYTAAIFLLFAFSGWLGRRYIGSGLRGYGALGLLWLGALLFNGSVLWIGRGIFETHAIETRAAITLIERLGGSPAIPADEGLYPIPGRDRLAEFAMYGSPMEDPLLGMAPPVPARVLDDVLYRLVADDLTVAAVDELPVGTALPEVTRSGDVSIRGIGPCVDVDPTGPDPRVTFAVPAGSSLALRVTLGGEMEAFLTLYDEASDETDSLLFWAAPSVPYLLTTPDIGNAVWQVRMDPPPTTTTRICGVAAS